MIDSAILKAHYNQLESVLEAMEQVKPTPTDAAWWAARGALASALVDLWGAYGALAQREASQAVLDRLKKGVIETLEHDLS